MTKTPRTRPQIYLKVNTQFENAGDALINRCLVELAALSGDVCVDISHCPKAFQNSLALEQFRNVTILKFPYLLLPQLVLSLVTGRTVYFLLSPGAYFGDIARLPPLRKQVADITLRLLAVCGLRICHIGASYERIGPRLEHFLRRRSRYLFAHFARDSRSLNYCIERNIRVQGVIPDLSFLMRSKIRNKQSGPLTVALCFRSDQYHNQGGEVLQFLTWLVGFLQKDTRYVVVGQVKRDYPFAQSLSEHLSTLGAFSSLSRCHDSLQDCESAYQSCDLVIGNRLHGLLIGGLYCNRMVACVGKGFNEKIVGVFEDLGVPDQIVNISDLELTKAAVAISIAASRLIDTEAKHILLLEEVKKIFD